MDVSAKANIQHAATKVTGAIISLLYFSSIQPIMLNYSLSKALMLKLILRSSFLKSTTLAVTS